MPLILAINPGSTTTKIALYDGPRPVFLDTIAHSAEELAAFARIADQQGLRRDAILASLAAHGSDVASLAAVVGRGGMLRPVPGGTFHVSERMLAELRRPAPREHASNLGALIAHEIAAQAGIPAFIVDPVSVDEAA